MLHPVYSCSSCLSHQLWSDAGRVEIRCRIWSQALRVALWLNSLNCRGLSGFSVLVNPQKFIIQLLNSCCFPKHANEPLSGILDFLDPPLCLHSNHSCPVDGAIVLTENNLFYMEETTKSACHSVFDSVCAASALLSTFSPAPNCARWSHSVVLHPVWDRPTCWMLRFLTSFSFSPSFRPTDGWVPTSHSSGLRAESQLSGVGPDIDLCAGAASAVIHFFFSFSFPPSYRYLSLHSPHMRGANDQDVLIQSRCITAESWSSWRCT